MGGVVGWVYVVHLLLSSSSGLLHGFNYPRTEYNTSIPHPLRTNLLFGQGHVYTCDTLVDNKLAET